MELMIICDVIAAIVLLTLFRGLSNRVKVLEDSASDQLELEVEALEEEENVKKAIQAVASETKTLIREVNELQKEREMLSILVNGVEEGLKDKMSVQGGNNILTKVVELTNLLHEIDRKFSVKPVSKKRKNRKK